MYDKYDNIVKYYAHKIMIDLIFIKLISLSTTIIIENNSCDLCISGFDIPNINMNNVGEKYFINTSITNDVLSKINNMN